MATSLALRRIATSRLLNLTRPTSVLPSISRSFNTNAQMTTRGGDDDYDQSIDDVGGRRRGLSRRGEYVPSFSDLFDPFTPNRSVTQLMNMMDQMMDSPFSATRTMQGGIRRGWEAKEDENALHLRVDMPGLGKEDVKISVEQNTLVIKGEEGERDSDEEEIEGRRYSSRVELPPELYKVDGIKAEMKNGVLKVMVPKVKEEERKDVIQVNVE